ncbi:ATP-dependent RNA helicase dbp10 [Penicillium subrubescens]|uniref:ATP-dependent RNA helicase DBP10 n=1 Tax=Penicillium subrubescens TaxID=1316194 RepID=A0A1Q5TQL1_9EURO|nr:ATP-dependent RNA helicase dbp10 [Penicillium subrubescens]KAJ5900513.1 ATP-dependent RNA helicase dbp10 [Penicillium subrubescens]OKP02513.1 ATP-dependent RNA helicase dbp10 [Penicillium subrubescens]
MPRRGREASPAMSENEFDITSALFQNDNDSDVDVGNSAPRQKPNTTQDLDFLNADDDGDAAFIATQQASANRKGSNLKGRTVKKGGGFQVMGLNSNLLKAIARKGFSVPTPIQRKTIPVIMDDKDVVGMARTGSGKTAAFVIPMIEKLKSHSATFGARALIMSPSRELALQTLKVVKEMGRGTDLRSVLLVGGDSLEDQFAMMAGNPDIVIATPGRFLHLKVEMDLDLSSIRYVVFDEADRLFEMGFAAQLTEILHGLPSHRQTLLFSATLPKSLVEFARAGLQEPSLVRLDTESKISPDLQNAFFAVKSSDKEGALLHILHNIIKMPTGPTEATQRFKAEGDNFKDRKRKRPHSGRSIYKESPTEHSTIVFAATKHHVDYLYSLLVEAGFATSYAYGSLDQLARKIQVENFRKGISNILVVTDVAARGIDIPVLANVINYDFPSQPKIFVHRVGRTARAGQAGWSYSLVRDADAPYLLDLQLFLGRRLVVGRQFGTEVNYAEDVVTGTLSRDPLSQSCEWVNKVLAESTDIASQRQVSVRGEKLYMRTRNAASIESAKRAKKVTATEDWSTLHPLFNDDESQMEAEREKMLARIGGFRPSETVFEVQNRRGGKQEGGETIDTIKRLRATVDKKKLRAQSKEQSELAELGITVKQANGGNDDVEDDDIPDEAGDNMSEADESDLEVTFSSYNQKGKTDQSNEISATSFQNPDYFMGYTPANHNSAEDRAYGVHSGTNSNFAHESRNATMDLNGDEGQKNFGENRSVMRWDKRHKKYVARQNDEDGSKGTRLVRGESGAKIAASFRSGRFQSWKKGKRMSNLPRVGEAETPGLSTGSGIPGAHGPGGRFRHQRQQAPKRADPLRYDYEKQKKKNDTARDRQQSQVGGAASHGKSEIRSTDDIRKARKLQQRRREKNARPSRKR